MYTERPSTSLPGVLGGILEVLLQGSTPELPAAPLVRQVAKQPRDLFRQLLSRPDLQAAVLRPSPSTMY